MITFKFCIPCYYGKWINKRFQFFKYLVNGFGETDGYSFSEEIDTDTFRDDYSYFFLGKNKNYYEDDELIDLYCVPLFIGKIISWFNSKIKKTN